MYSRGSGKGTPIWLVVLIGMLLIFGGYFLWSGVLRFLNASGDITAQITAQAAEGSQPADGDIPTEPPYIRPTATPIRICLDFRVNVVKARMRECPKDTCSTLESMPSQGNIMCVYGPAPGATDWYEVNLRPTSAYPQIVYMHSSVLDAVNPTKRPTRTATALPTVTPIPTVRPTRTPTPPPTDKPNPTPPNIPPKATLTD